MQEQTVTEYNADAGKWEAVVAETTPASELVETPTPEATASDVAEQQADERAEKVDEKPAKAAKPRNDPEARIAQVIAKQREAERRAEEAERKARDLEARLQPRAEPNADEKPAQAEKFPEYAAYLQQHPDASLEQWLDARDEWRDTQRAKQEQQKRYEADDYRLASEFDKRATAFVEKLKSAEAADQTLHIDRRLLSGKPLSLLTRKEKAEIAKLPPREREELGFVCFLADQWDGRENDLELLKHLSDPQTFQRLATLPPNQVIWELASFTRQSASGAAKPQAPAPSPKPQPSKAPAPIEPVGSSPHVSDDSPSDADSDEEWLRKENARLLRARRRG